MALPLAINRNAVALAAAAVLCATVLPRSALAAGPDVTIANVPLPVTGTVNAAVSGTVNANVTNTVLPVSGTVGVSSLPSVTVSSLPAVNVASLPAVSLTLPAHPFFDEMTLITAGSAKALGVSGQRLAVTTLTISNFDANTQQLFVFNPVMSGGSCSGSPVGGSTPLAHLILEPFKTVQLQFPTPMVFSLSGLGCIAAEVTTNLSGGSVVVGVVGFTAP